MLKKAPLTIVFSLLALFVLLSLLSSNQAGRERQKQAAIEAFDRKRVEDTRVMEGGVASKEDRGKQIQQDLDADKEMPISARLTARS